MGRNPVGKTGAQSGLPSNIACFHFLINKPNFDRSIIQGYIFCKILWLVGGGVELREKKKTEAVRNKMKKKGKRERKKKERERGRVIFF